MSRPRRPARAEMRDHLARVYGRHGGLPAQKRLVSVYRPYYCPVHALLDAVPARSNVLEIGCGTGPLLFLLKEFGAIATGRGVDSNREAIEIAATVNVDDGLAFVCGDALRLDPEEYAHFDVVVCFDLLHHIPPADKGPFLSRLIERLRPGARLIVKDLDARPRRKALANRVTDYLSTRSRVSYWRRAQTLEFLTARGMTRLHDADLADWIWSHYIVVVER